MENNITEEEYYELMGNMDSLKTFKKLHEAWYKCFNHILNSFNVGFTEKAIRSLYFDFDMSNWKAMWKENSEYKDCTYEELLKVFKGECSYISDRVSYDRLFRTHWIFRQIFEEDLNKLQFPKLYK